MESAGTLGPSDAAGWRPLWSRLRARSSTPENLDFPPVRNGIDYLGSVVDHLDEESGGELRDLKYAVLHLQAAAEVLLKVRLIHEHWSLVFKDPRNASKSKYDTAQFESCGTDAAVQRLRDIAGVPIDTGDAKALKDLAEDRNALQHYGLTRNAKAVQSRAGDVLDFLVRFLDEELLPRLNLAEQEEIVLDMARIREGLNRIETFIDTRMNRIRAELKAKADRVIDCPHCEQRAVVLTPGKAECRFCNEAWAEPEELIAEYLYGHPDAETLVSQCPTCDEFTLSEGIVFANGERELRYCFSCATHFDPAELTRCASCSRPWPHEGDDDGTTDTLCTTCREYAGLN
ncbi:hypothetical protein ACIQUQ_30315 [Streptomyces sp. NPDC101118]|uniref:hypothetical protein n=1 Tax=Streptomyces sp. NPDC101118 TaxID=3366109 RepID=UPI0037F3D35F